jgi:hypothetical protein
MAEHADFGSPEDSLDIVELVMAIDEVLIDRNLSPDKRERLTRALLEILDSDVSPGERDPLIGSIKARIASGEFGEGGDFDDDALTALVRKPGPRSPRGQAGASAHPEDP